MIGIFCGMSAHSFHYIIDGWQGTPRQWKLLARYTVGGFAVITAHFLRSWRRAGWRVAEDEAGVLLVSFSCVGFGVGLAHIIDDLLKKRKENI